MRCKRVSHRDKQLCVKAPYNSSWKVGHTGQGPMGAIRDDPESAISVSKKRQQGEY